MQISIEFKKQILKSNTLGKWPEDLKKKLCHFLGEIILKAKLSVITVDCA